MTLDDLIARLERLRQACPAAGSARVESYMRFAEADVLWIAETGGINLTLFPEYDMGEVHLFERRTRFDDAEPVGGVQ